MCRLPPNKVHLIYYQTNSHGLYERKMTFLATNIVLALKLSSNYWDNSNNISASLQLIM